MFKITIKTTEQRHSGVFIFNFEHTPLSSVSVVTGSYGRREVTGNI